MVFASINWNPDVEIFKIGSFAVRYYSLMFVIAFVLGLQIMKKIFNREGVPIEKLDSLFIYTVVATLLGARLGHFLFYDPEFLFSRPLEVLLPIQLNPFRFTGYQGLASHGAAIGILIALWLFARKAKKPYVWILDRIVIVVALAGFFIRMGNLMNSEIYGIETSLPWGFIFVRWNETVPKHPTQIYEGLSYLAIFVILFMLYQKKGLSLKPGILFGFFLTVLFAMRFLIEFIKEPQVGFEETMALNMGQILSIPFILAGIYFLFLHARKQGGPVNKKG